MCPSGSQNPSSSSSVDLLSGSSSISHEQAPAQRSNILSVYENDIGHFINSNVDDMKKYNILKNPWRPPVGYKFPYEVRNIQGKEVKCYLGMQHFKDRKWLVFSPLKQGLFCIYCVLFCPEEVGHNKGVAAQKFVRKPVTSYSKLFGKEGSLATHEKAQYHTDSIRASQNLIRILENPQDEIINQLNTQRLEQVAENRARLRPIIETVIFLGRQNIPLRGHRDDGVLDEDALPSNEGNFRELLKFKVASGDDILKMHLATAEARATYIGKNTQNDIIKSCEEEITSVILERVREAGYYAILFDETTDVSHIEQMSFSIRYIYKGKIHEDFLKFIDCYSSPDITVSDLGERKLSGKALGRMVLNIMNELSLNLDLCVGIGTDNCTVMSSELVGAVKEVIEEAKNARRVPCYNHALNNSLAKSNSVANVRNTVGTMKSVISFFNTSAKKNIVMKNMIDGQLKSLCETRWVERHDGILQFRTYFKEIVKILNNISKWGETNTSSTASSLAHSLCTPQFILSTFSLVDILEITLPISQKLQKPDLDLHRASKVVQNTLYTLEMKRIDADSAFSGVFEEASELAEAADVELKAPRTAGRQIHRENHAAGSAKEYFKRCIYIPLLDNICADFKERFADSTLQCFGLRYLMPSILLSEDVDLEKKKKKLEEVLDEFSPLLFEDKNLLKLKFRGELCLWINQWKSEECIPDTVMDLLNSCDEDLYPTITSLLKILATLPVSVASAERSFSTLRRVKTWLRSRMTEERLSGLCLMHVHKDIHIDIGKIIDRFSKSKNRRLDFIL